MLPFVKASWVVIPHPCDPALPSGAPSKTSYELQSWLQRVVAKQTCFTSALLQEGFLDPYKSDTPSAAARGKHTTTTAAYGPYLCMLLAWSGCPPDLWRDVLHKLGAHDAGVAVGAADLRRGCLRLKHTPERLACTTVTGRSSTNCRYKIAHLTRLTAGAAPCPTSLGTCYASPPSLPVNLVEVARSSP